MAPRFIDRASAADANILPAPLPILSRAPEPAAFLTMDLEIAKASSTFTDAIGRSAVNGLKLTDVVISADRDRILSHQRQLREERSRDDPQYLPPIFGKPEEERVFQGLGFSPEEMVRYALDRQDFLTFSAQDGLGLGRGHAVRMGLAKQGSIYFIVVLLNITVRPFGHPTPSPHPRDPRGLPYAYQPLQQQPYSQPTPASATFETGRPRLGSDPGYGQRQPGAPAASSSYQIPRSELGLASRAPQPGYQLPPIRSQQPAPPPPSDPSWQRDDKSRVDIGGLIDTPDPPKRMQ